MPALVEAAHKWVNGEVPSENFRVEVDKSLTAFLRTQRRVNQLDTPKDLELPHRLYEASADLYVETARTYMLALDADDAWRVQLDLLARRLRELGDRVFDRGRAAIGIEVSQNPDVDVRAPEEVPIWTAEGLAAGPPLDDPPPPPNESPPLRQESRRVQSRAGWERDVRRANAPSATRTRAAIKAGNADRLRSIARAYVAAAEFLRAKPDARNGREESARLRLSWLVAADAARAAQAGLPTVAERLERTATMIWP